MRDPDPGPARTDGGEAGHPHAEHARETESGTVRTNDVETHYLRRGNGPPVVFVHGMALSASQWEPQMEALSDDYTAIAYDVRGHGHTGGSHRESYTMELYAADLDEQWQGRGYNSRSEFMREALRDSMYGTRLSKRALEDLLESERQFADGETVSADEARERFGMDE